VTLWRWLAAIINRKGIRMDIVGRYLPFADPNQPLITQRHYLLHDGRTGPNTRIVVALHGGHGGAVQFANTTGFHSRGENAITLYPNGVKHGPNGTVIVDEADSHWRTYSVPPRPHDADELRPDDLGFLAALIDAVAAEFSLPAKAYVVGHSNGGTFAYKVGANLTSRVLALAPVSCSFFPCEAPTVGIPTPAPLPMHFFCGKLDGLVPWGGDADNPPPLDCIVPWVVANGATQPPVAWGPLWEGGMEYTGTNATRVRYNRVPGYSHGWMTGGFDATAKVWAFFKLH
jgi:poly(3-hydroxybutyrate) depolymerase